VSAAPTIDAALRTYLAQKGMPADSGRSQRWVAVRWLGLPIVFPNFDARRRVLFLHDVHHLLTGYPTTWTGEGEIGAFELRTGCGRLWAAWLFNGGGFLFGLVIAPRALFRAFVRARGCRNFYGTDERRVATLEVATARAELGLDRPPERATLADRVQFAAWTLGVVAVYVALPIAALLTIRHLL
jgi:hypothetical protein